MVGRYTRVYTPPEVHPGYVHHCIYTTLRYTLGYTFLLYTTLRYTLGYTLLLYTTLRYHRVYTCYTLRYT